MALATIATSKLKGNWTLATPVPQLDNGRATLLLVEASHPPRVRANGDVLDAWRQISATSWEFLVPAGATLDAVDLVGECIDRGLCRGLDCEIPSPAFVRVASTTPVTTWKVEDREEHVADLWGEPHAYFKVEVETSQPTAKLDVGTGDGTVLIHQKIAGGWLVEVQRGSSGIVAWSALATLTGLCPTLEPCAPPADAKVAITWISRGKP